MPLLLLRRRKDPSGYPMPLQRVLPSGRLFSTTATQLLVVCHALEVKTRGRKFPGLIRIFFVGRVKIEPYATKTWLSRQQPKSLNMNSLFERMHSCTVRGNTSTTHFSVLPSVVCATSLNFI